MQKSSKEITEENYCKINDSRRNLERQVAKNRIVRNKLEVLEKELKLYDRRIYWNELVANCGVLESAPFHTTADLYCLSLSVKYDVHYDSLDIYLHRCRG